MDSTICHLALFVCAIACSCCGVRSAAEMPVSTDLAPRFRAFGLDPRSQGARNTCSLFAVTAIANYEYCRAATHPGERPSEEFLVWAANEATGLGGDQAMFYEAVHGLNTLGICREESMPYRASSDPAQHPSPQAIADAKTRAERWQVHWIRRWNVASPLSDIEFGAIKSALAADHPVACGLRWPSAQSGSDILDVPAPDGVYDGHSIVLTGYRDDRKATGGGLFMFRNSAGPGWGIGGYGTMSYAYVRAYANDAFWLEYGRPECEAPAVRIEAETMEVGARERCDPSVQSMRPWGAGMWSHGKQLVCRAEDGGFIELKFSAPDAGRYRVRILATTAQDYGRISAMLDGKPVGDQFDLYSGRISPAGSFELGIHKLRAGDHALRITVAGRHPASTGFSFGLDAVDLLRAD